MKLQVSQLTVHLQGKLAPIYMVGGDEPLQINEASDQIRAVARQQGCSERQVFQVGPDFKWDHLQTEMASLSLFADRRIIELRMPTAKPGMVGAKVLDAYAKEPAEDIVLLLNTGRVDKKTQQSKWFKSIEKSGVVLLVWPIERNRLPAWIEARLRSRGLQADPDAVQILTNRVEGNLLAAAQEIEKLLLLKGAGTIDAETMQQATTNSARFDIYDLVDASLQGHAARSLRILDGLRAEDSATVLVLWALHREIRMLHTMAFALQHGETLAQQYRKHWVVEKRRRLVETGLRRHNLRKWQAMLRYCNEIDCINKGESPGDSWEALLHLSMCVVGVENPPANQ